jgi:TolA-binding protein
MVLKIDKGRFGILLAVVEVALLAVPGCWFVTTKKEGRQLKEQLAKVQKKQQTMQRQRRELADALAKSRRDQKKLTAMLEEARKVLLRNSADLGAKVEVLEEKIGRILGRLDNVEKDLKAVVAKQKTERKKLLEIVQAIKVEFESFKKQVIAWRKKPALPQGADALFGAAQKKHRLGAYPIARKYFQLFADRYPQDKRVELALYQIAESYYKENKFGAAVYKYRQYLSKYPKGKHAPEAWLKRAKCHFELKYCKSALKILKKLRKNFRGTDEAREALALYKKIRRMLGNPRYCGN